MKKLNLMSLSNSEMGKLRGGECCSCRCGCTCNTVGSSANKVGTSSTGNSNSSNLVTNSAPPDTSLL